MDPMSTVTRRTPAELPRVRWEDLGPQFIEDWGRPGGRFEPEHLTVYGRSGSGKTQFVAWSLNERATARGSHVTIVATKRADQTLTRMGWPVIDTWPPGYGETCVIYWAKAKGLTATHRVPQKRKVKELMDALWRPDSNMIVYWDELTYIQRDLRLTTELETFYREGRTHGITNVASMQRPSNVTRLSHSESGWTVAFPPKDMDDRKRVAEVMGDRLLYMHVLGGLNQELHEFVIKHERSGMAYISHIPVHMLRRRTGSARAASYSVRSPR